MFSCFGYGLSIRSYFQLSELPTTGTSPDVSIRFGHLYSAPSNGKGGIGRDQTLWIYIPKVGKFLVPSGQEIVVCPIPDVEERLLGHCILGTGVPMLLHERNHLILHASAVEIDGKAIAFLGGCGGGKSTMAAALHALGYNIVADDVLCVDFNGETHPLILPGFPFLKLHHQSAAILTDRVENLPRVHSMDLRFVYRQSQGFSVSPIPLGGIYLLDRDQKIQVEPMTPKQGFQKLISHSHASGLIKDTFKEAQHFQQCAEVAAAVPVRRLKRDLTLSTIAKVTDAILQDLENKEGNSNSG
jgi:hypothetical protein